MDDVFAINIPVLEANNYTQNEFAKHLGKKDTIIDQWKDLAGFKKEKRKKKDIQNLGDPDGVIDNIAK